MITFYQYNIILENNKLSFKNLPVTYKLSYIRGIKISFSIKRITAVEII